MNLEKETIEYLKNQSLYIVNLEANRTIFLGIILNEIFKKLGNHHEGEYTNYLKKLNIEPRTALRYRNRATLFEKCSSNFARKVIIKLSHDDIDKIFTNKLQETILFHIEKGANVDVIKMFIKSNCTITNKIEFSEKFESENFNNINEELTKKWNLLDKRKKEKISKLLLKMKKILELNEVYNDKL